MLESILEETIATPVQLELTLIAALALARIVVMAFTVVLGQGRAPVHLQVLFSAGSYFFLFHLFFLE